MVVHGVVVGHGHHVHTGPRQAGDHARVAAKDDVLPALWPALVTERRLEVDEGEVGGREHGPDVVEQRVRAVGADVAVDQAVAGHVAAAGHGETRAARGAAGSGRCPSGLARDRRQQGHERQKEGDPQCRSVPAGRRCAFRRHGPGCYTGRRAASTRPAEGEADASPFDQGYEPRELLQKVVGGTDGGVLRELEVEIRELPGTHDSRRSLQGDLPWR